MERAEIKAIYARAQVELGKLPGVAGVGFGLKETGGKTRMVPSIQVYVARKRPAAELPPEERIPETFEGFPLDVMEAPVLSPIGGVDTVQHNPLLGGTVITNFKIDPNNANEVRRGTLGFFATLNDVAEPKNVVLVSNNHVLTAFGGTLDDSIYHPSWSGNPPTLDKDSGPIGKINKLGKDGNVKYTYKGETELDYFVDCATALLNICISSWCGSNCGVAYKNEIRELALDNCNKLRDVARVDIDDILNAPGSLYEAYKVGGETGRTEGMVTGVEVTGSAGEQRMIRVESIGSARFCSKGDSGSALVNKERHLIGILHAEDPNDPTKGYGCHIHPVMQELNITPITSQNPPLGPAGKSLAGMSGFTDGIDETVRLRERFLATARGAEIHDAVVVHRAEVVELVNHHRPVTLAWHRAKGPAFLAHGIENARNPAHKLPRAIEGCDRPALARRMAAVLAEHGTPALAAAMAQWLPFVLAHIEDFDSLHALVARFEPEGVDG